MTRLPIVEIQGPARPDAPSIPFWVLRAVAPEFGLENVKPPDKGVQEDRVHPIRTSLLDPGETELEGFRLTRMESVHVIAGQISTFAHPDDERLIVHFTKKKSAEVEIPPSRVFDKTRIPFYSSGVQRAGVHHLKVEPILDRSKDSPKLKKNSIDVPPYRLMAGAIDILLNRDLIKNFGEALLFAKEKLEGLKAILIRLTPSGIEIDAKMPFPGSANDLDGRFLLAPDRKGLRIRLLSDRLTPEQAKKWRTAWNAVTPATDAAEETVFGLKVDMHHAELPPAFAWTAILDGGKIDKLAPEVEVPADALSVRLLSPTGPGGLVDGEVTLNPESYTLAKFDPKLAPVSIEKTVKEWPPPKVMLMAQLKPAESLAKSPETRLVLNASKDGTGVGLEVAIKEAEGHRCAHDEIALAAALRTSYGIDDPRPGAPDPQRPLLSAFVPLDDGWLQLPVPNVPPPDRTKDVDRVPTVPPTPNVLSGYLRYAHSGALAPVLSVWPAPNEKDPALPVISEAPWVITVEGTQSLAAVIGIDTDGTTATLVRAAVALDGPELSTRGLIWISDDRPDAFEALPRIGAGAGAYFDIPLETLDSEKKPVVLVTITELALSASKTGLKREKLTLTTSFDTAQDDWKNIAAAGAAVLKAASDIIGGTLQPLPPVVWRRHPQMPLAAAMPMTRGAGSSVRPLESRDLVPFAVNLDKTKLTLQWRVNKVFPQFPEKNPLLLKPVAKWPWPKKGKEEPYPQGIALTAFGVPGAELALGEDENFALNPWASVLCALRYDLPSLDEAFATATLPPIPPDSTVPAERETLPEPPVPLAYDWPAMSLFWRDQNRRHQLARVAHSYIVPFRTPGVQLADVKQLVGGLTWNTKVGFETPLDGETMPYGRATVGATTMSENKALLGISGGFSKVADQDVLIDAGTAIDVVGYAPSSFVEKGFLMDSRRTGTQPAKPAGDLLLRPIRIAVPSRKNDRSKNVTALATLVHALPVEKRFRFWFKDLPVAGDQFVPPPETTEFDAWQDGRLPLSGFEWRLISAAGPEPIFRLGRDRIPFFGFALEPLRLLSCSLKDNTVENATLLARLHLGPSRPGAAADGNLVTLALKKRTVAKGADSELEIASLTARDSLRFTLENTVKTVVSATCFWDSGLKFENVSVMVETLDEQRTFPLGTIKAEDAGVTLIGAPKQNDLVLLPGMAALTLDGVTIVTGVHPTGESKDVEVTLDRRILVAPRGSAKPSEAIKPPLTVALQNDKVTKLQFLGLVLPNKPTFQERNGTFTLIGSSPVKGALLPGIAVEGTFDLGLTARTGRQTDGNIDLTTGYLDGELATKPAADARAALTRVTFHADCRRRPERREQKPDSEWGGTIRLFGRLSIDNTIGWPDIANGEHVDLVIPWPDPNAKENDGRVDLTILTKAACTHHVDYFLDNHTLPFDLAARILARKTDAIWTAPVVSMHLLTMDAAKLRFTAVETIAIGAAEAIVPRPVDPDDPSDLVTFAPRFRDRVVNGKDKDQEPGMVAAGAGRIGTVLRGALGMPFRRAFWAATPQGLFVAGGFVGLVASRDGENAPLVRLPVLAPLEKDQLLGQPGLITQRNPDKDLKLDVAWADGRTARNVIATLRHATTPTSSSDGALREALMIGSRPSARTNLTADQTVAAVLVEQSFVARWDELFPKPDLTRQPFFFAAAVSVKRLLASLKVNRAPIVLSLIAGHGVAGDESRSLAAVVLTRNLPVDLAKGGPQRRPQPELATLGDDVVVAPWTGPAVADLADVIPVGLVAGPALVEHTQPRAAMLRTVSAAGVLRYDAPPLPGARERARFTTPLPGAQRAYADPGRGFGLVHEKTEDPTRWLASPEEGPMRPFRDTDGTGLAGLSRVMTMAAHAEPVRTDDPNATARRLVWIAQTRAPIFLDLPLAGVKAPPIPWLTPGTPRARLPIDDAVRAAAGATQAILPSAATVASVGDRAGISMARIARLETPLGVFGAFDGRHGRFGRPAQGGSWSVRTERTPRPGPLPENSGDPDRDRRPCATALLSKAPLHALVGPADTVAGEPNDAVKLGRWSVTFVAAPEWNGMITENWDGTIRLLAEVDVACREKDVDAPTDVVATLFRLLFPGAANAVDARAALVAGKTVVPFLRIRVVDRELSTFKLIDRAGRPTTIADKEKLKAGDVIRRGVVRLIFDARPDDESKVRGAAIGAVADALAVVPLPHVEVSLLVHPDSSRPAQAAPKDVVALTVDKADTATLAEGGGRAPVTLHLPLSPVVRSRGALPLAPTSILFIDPAYDAGLSSAPAEDRGRISGSGAPLKEGRGALFAVLAADRAHVNRRGTITFMFDLAFERKADRAARMALDKNKVDGDIVSVDTGALALKLAVVPKDGAQRTLFVAKPSPEPVPGFAEPKQPRIVPARVYELQLTNIVETDGTAAKFVAGDILELEVAEAAPGIVKVTMVGDKTDLSDKATVIQLHETRVSRKLRILLTDEPVVEPPPALYAALVRRTEKEETDAAQPAQLSLPLYAQSPLPYRVDLRDAKADFRRGLMRRSATFIWTLARPAAERTRTGIFVVKADRNGQTFLPINRNPFEKARSL